MPQSREPASTVSVDAHDRMYWQYEYDVCLRYIVPLLNSWGVRPGGASILDVGCAEGGGLCALHDGGGMCVGFDVEESRVEKARALQGPRAITFATGDLYAERVPFDDRQFDLVTLHDVFEHLDHKPAMIGRLKNFLKPGGGSSSRSLRTIPRTGDTSSISGRGSPGSPSFISFPCRRP